MANYNNTQTSGSGAVPVWIAGYGKVPLGYQQLALTSAAQNLTVPTGATVAAIYVTATGGVARYRDDGVAPTSTVGMPLSTGAQFIYSGSLSAIQFILGSGATATLDISYYA